MNRNPVSGDHRRMRYFMLAHGVWVLFVLLLGAWWGRLGLIQASRIAELEKALGVSKIEATLGWEKTQRMIVWEGGTFFALLLLSTGVLVWLYWRDLKRSRGLQAFFASVTHELRTPLTGIRLQAEALAERLPDGGAEKKWSDRLLEDVLRLESQLERSLELARVEAGGSLALQSIALKPWLERFSRNWSAVYGSRVEFEFDLQEEHVCVDPLALHVVMKNLVENSIRHSGKKGEDRIRIRMTTQRLSDSVVLSFEDDGKGYTGSLAALGKLFYKGEQSSGAGVGLYLVKSLIRKMGGKAFFFSKGKGEKRGALSSENLIGFQVVLNLQREMG